MAIRDLMEKLKTNARHHRNVVINVGDLFIPLKPKDAKSIELVEQLQDYSFGEAVEILQDAIVWLNIIAILSETDRYNAEIKGEIP